jgi:hypothetical protein
VKRIEARLIGYYGSAAPADAAAARRALARVQDQARGSGCRFAAQACFGTPDWPAERPVPPTSVEFEVADAETVQAAAD